MTFQVIEKPKVFEAIKVAEDNLPHAARMLSDFCTTDQVRQYMGAYLVKKGMDIYVCCEEDFWQFYMEAAPPTSKEEIVGALEWAQQNLGKHTRPSPVDAVLTKLK